MVCGGSLGRLVRARFHYRFTTSFSTSLSIHPLRTCQDLLNMYNSNPTSTVPCILPPSHSFHFEEVILLHAFAVRTRASILFAYPDLTAHILPFSFRSSHRPPPRMTLFTITT